jgi:hypothetical protein
MKKNVFKLILSIFLIAELAVAIVLLYNYVSKNNQEIQLDEVLVEETSVSILEEAVVKNSTENTNDDQIIETQVEVETEEKTQNESFGIEISEVAELLKQSEGAYALENMESSFRQLYGEIYYIILNLKQDVQVSSLSKADIEYAFQCVLIDHPEIYYVDGYTYTTYTQNDMIVKIHFSGNYTKTKEEVTSLNQQLETAVMNCISGIQIEAEDYLKVKYCYEYLANHTVYNLESAENQNLLSVLLYGESVCQGYAKAMQYLLTRMGVYGTLVVGTVDGGIGHAWNLVRMNGNYYYVDSTWGDAFYVFDQNQTQEFDSNLLTINYDYLGVTTEQLNKTHVIDNPVPLPRCLATDDNYYVREGAFFQSYDVKQVALQFQKAYDTGQKLVTLKCSGQSVFDEMFQDLIVNQTVFSYLSESSTSVAYADNQEQLSLTFFLNQ